jgi:membrane fusion protein (multidrug efflux system)
MAYDEPELRGGATQTEARVAELPARAEEDAPVRERPARAAPDFIPPESRPGDDGDGRRREPEQRRGNARMWIILGLLALLAVAGGATYWYLTKDEVNTDDANTDGRSITIAPQVSGYVVELAVTDNQRVNAGQTLVRIDPRDYVAARDQAQGELVAAQGQLDAARAALALAQVSFPAKLDSARAQRDAAQAVLTRAQADLRRQRGVSAAATTQQQIDEATAGERQAVAQLGEAEANLKQAQLVAENIAQVAAQVKQLEGQVAQAKGRLDQALLNLSYTTVTAPQDGWVTKRNVERGNYLTAGGSIMSLVSPEVWVTANFKETQLDRMRPGQRVTIAVDAYPGLKLRGHVDSVQLGAGSRFSAFPAENATGNFVKIVQRVPVKIDIDSGLDPNLPLPLGLSVEPTVLLK